MSIIHSDLSVTRYERARIERKQPTDNDDALDADVLQVSRLLDKHAAAALDDGDLAGELLGVARRRARLERLRKRQLNNEHNTAEQ